MRHLVTPKLYYFDLQNEKDSAIRALKAAAFKISRIVL